MKKLFTLSLLTFFLFACPPVSQKKNFSKIEYEAYTRGSANYILIKEGVLKHVLNRQDTTTITLKEKQNTKLYNLLKDLELSSLEKLALPSTRHQTDGSMAATLAISDTNQKEYVTSTFDDDNPPKEIKPLIEYLKSLTQEKE